MSSEHTTPDSSEYAIEVNGLSKCYQIYDKPSDRLKQMLMRGRKQYYKEFWALKDVSFKIKKGETVGIIGRNGSGKSTLLQMICGTLNPTGGEVKVNGRVAALLELGAGFNPEFSGVENVYMAASLYGLSKEEVDLRFDAIAAFADIGDHIHQPVKTYSSGMYVRLAFAVIAHVNAEILVVDEALAVGDAFFTQKCMRFLRGFMKSGTVLFVSHDTAAVINLCNTAIWLEHGSVHSLGLPKKISEKYLRNIYEGDSTKEPDEKFIEEREVIKSSMPQEDVRHGLFEGTKYENQIEIFSFNENEISEFGLGSAKIAEVIMHDNFGNLMRQCVGGELVDLKITVDIIDDLINPIVGFVFKDRLGQVLFGDNTYITYRMQKIELKSGSRAVAQFRFLMPIIPLGDYTIGVAIATGTQNDHRQEHWIHDALLLRSISTSVSTGLVGLPMQMIVLEEEKRN
jgi:lipopolysaccharide transport system ATP-binding protein